MRKSLRTSGGHNASRRTFWSALGFFTHSCIVIASTCDGKQSTTELINFFVSLSNVFCLFAVFSLDSLKGFCPFSMTVFSLIFNYKCELGSYHTTSFSKCKCTFTGDRRGSGNSKISILFCILFFG